MTLVLALTIPSCGQDTPVGPRPWAAPGTDVEVVAIYAQSACDIDIPPLPFSPGIGMDSDRDPLHAVGAPDSLWPIPLGLVTVPSVWLRGSGEFPNLLVRTWIDGQPVDRTVRGVVPPGQRFEIRVDLPPLTASGLGQHTMVVELDPEHVYPELDESNNRDSVVWNVVLPSLELVDFRGWVWWGTAETVNVGTAVLLQGQTSANSNFDDIRVVLEHDGVTLFDRRASTHVSSCFGLAAGRTDTLTWIANVPGTHVFTLEIDPDHELLRREDLANRKTFTVVVIP